MTYIPLRAGCAGQEARRSRDGPDGPDFSGRDSALSSKVTVTFCKKNLELHSQSVYDALSANNPEVTLEIKDCLDHCGMCTDVPFAMREGGLVGGRDPRDLYRKLLRGLRFLSRPPLPGTASYRDEASHLEAVKSAGAAAPGSATDR